MAQGLLHLEDLALGEKPHLLGQDLVIRGIGCLAGLHSIRVLYLKSESWARHVHTVFADLLLAKPGLRFQASEPPEWFPEQPLLSDHGELWFTICGGWSFGS